VPQATFLLFWDGEVPLDEYLRRKFEPLLEYAHLNSMIVNALRQMHELADLTRERYSQVSFYGDEGVGREATGLKPKLGNVGVSIAFVSCGTLSSD
jgi:hypothetical protein